MSIDVEANSNIPPLSIHRSYLAVKMLIKLRYKPKENSTIQLMNLNCCNMCITDFPVNSFVRRALNGCTMLDMCNINRICTKSMSKVPPWQKLDYVHSYKEENVYDNILFRDYVVTNYVSFRTCYTDGSKVYNPENSVACAVYYPHLKKTFSWKLHLDKSVLFSELFALRQALLYIKRYTIQNFVIFTDSQSAMELISGRSISYIEIVNEIQELLFDLNKGRQVIIHCIKGHVGMVGNEIVDKAANIGHHIDKSVRWYLTKEEMNSYLKKKFYNHWDQYW